MAILKVISWTIHIFSTPKSIKGDILWINLSMPHKSKPTHLSSFIQTGPNDDNLQSCQEEI